MSDVPVRRLVLPCPCVEETSSPRQLSLCPPLFQEHFMKAWEAIESERHDCESIKQSVSEMKSAAHTGGVLKPLDVFLLLEESEMVYAMTLMAFCGVHGRKDVVQLLLDEGAEINSGCNTCGAPLFQMMLHCLVHKVDVDATMVQFFIEKGSALDREITSFEVDDKYSTSYSLLDLPLQMPTVNGFEVAKVLVELGKVDPITGGSPRGETFNVVPMFEEYCVIGTNNYIRWLFKKCIPNHKRGEFLDRVLNCIASMKKDQGFTTWLYKRRTPSHAILTSGHQETIALLVQKGKEQGEDFLKETNSVSKTALHMAAENGDLESVEILLQLGADVTAYDNSNLNPFMLALQKGQKAVAEFMLKTNPSYHGSARETIEWALESNISLFFQVVAEISPDLLVTPGPFSDAGNTIVHLVVAAGNTEIFKIILKNLWSRGRMRQVVECRNGERRTALQLAVEKESIDILEAVEERLKKPGHLMWQAELQNKWQSDVIPPLLNHASSCGSLTAVKYFINNGYQPTMSHGDKNPLLCASVAGHDEIVAYLLQHRAVSSNPTNLKLPLLHAAANGHTKCVSLLLEKKASVLETDTTGRNCLMLAIHNHHKQTALAILSDNGQGLKALKCVGKETTPLRLLIKEMPELAEYALNRNIERENDKGIDEPDSGVVHSPLERKPSVTYDFQLLDDLLPENGSEDDEAPLIPGIPLVETDSSLERGATATPQHKLKNKSSNHILTWMTRYKRLKLLQHPLVKQYLFHKFWLVTLPLFLAYLLLYCVFLILLTSFALVSPRPGPDSETCPVGNANRTANGTDCAGQSGVERGFLTAAAVLLILLCCLLLFIEGKQLRQRHFKYFMEWDNYFQFTLFIVTIIFVAPGFTNDCWCARNGQWQTGAFALFLGWFNLIIQLKDIPCTAIPINMFINICITFLKVLFLPFLLLVAFALPFYMVFVRADSASEGMSVPALVSFTSPAHAIAKTMVQIVGEIDFEIIFNEGDLLYNPVTYILFVIFLIMMPVLFINLLIGLAVGDINEEKEKAEFTRIKVQVNFILERQRNCTLLQKCRNTEAVFDESDELFDPEGCCGKYRLTRFLAQLMGIEYKRHLIKAKQIEERNQAIYSEVMGISDIDTVKTTLKQQSETILQLKEELKSLTETVRSSQ